MGEPLDVVYLDFSRAFDKVPINKLLYKLEHFGVRGKLLSWIDSFLNNRQFMVRVGNDCSEKRYVMSGVPQGSVLGPVLFLVYVSDLTLNCTSKSLSYADDLKLFSTPCPTIQADMDLINLWCLEWSLPLNYSKCCVVHMFKNNPRLNYKIGGHDVLNVPLLSDLGVTVTETLSWSAHVSKVVRKCNQLIYMIRRSFQDLKKDTFLKIYNAYVRPHLEFGVSIWCPLLKQDIAMLEGVQRRATKLPSGFHKFPYTTRLALLNLQPLEQRRMRGDLITTYRIFHNEIYCPEDIFTLNMDSRLRGHELKLKKENFQTRIRQNFLPNRVFEKWNSLPNSVVTAPSLNSFKARLDHFLKSERE